MLANFFGKSNPANFILLFLLFLGFFFAALFSDFSLVEIKSNDWGMYLTTIGLFILLFFFFNFILAKNKLTLYNSYGFLFFVLLFGIFPITMFDRHELVVNLTILILLRRIYSLRTPKVVLKKMFDSGFWLSILFILNPFTLVYGVLLYASIFIFQKLTIRTFLIPIVGFAAPLLCYFTYCFWYDNIDSFLDLFAWYTNYDFQLYKEPKLLIPLIFIGVVSLFSILFKTPKAFLISGNYRKFWSLTILNLLVSVALVLFTVERTGAELMCLFFPIAVILTNGVEGLSKRFFKDLILGIFLLIPIILLII